MQVTFLGKDLGEASGWDGDPGECWWVYDFVPNVDSDFPFVECKCLQFDETKGMIHAQDDEGNNLQSWKIDWTITEQPR